MLQYRIEYDKKARGHSPRAQRLLERYKLETPAAA
jgi:hypothetical protein